MKMNQNLPVILCAERKIKDDLEKQRSSNNNGSNPPEIDNFIARQVGDQKWEIEFSKRNMMGGTDKAYMLAAKRGGIRKFARLSGVLAWMKRMGIREFKVVLSDLS